MTSLDTQTRLLEAAHSLFAEQGFAATSTREITAVADANLAAVNYHFGSKEGLLLAVLHHTIGPINEERMDGIAAAEARHADSPVPLDEVLRIFLGPVLREFAADCAMGRGCLISRMHLEPHSGVAQAMAEVMEPIIFRFVGAVQRVLPHLTPASIIQRATFLFGAMIYTLDAGPAKIQHLLGADYVAPTADELLDSLVRFGTAGMSHDA